MALWGYISRMGGVKKRKVWGSGLRSGTDQTVFKITIICHALARERQNDRSWCARIIFHFFLIVLIKMFEKKKNVFKKCFECLFASVR